MKYNIHSTIEIIRPAIAMLRFFVDCRPRYPRINAVTTRGIDTHPEMKNNGIDIRERINEIKAMVSFESFSLGTPKYTF